MDGLDDSKIQSLIALAGTLRDVAKEVVVGVVMEGAVLYASSPGTAGALLPGGVLDIEAAVRDEPHGGPEKLQVGGRGGNVDLAQPVEETNEGLLVDRLDLPVRYTVMAPRRPCFAFSIPSTKFGKWSLIALFTFIATRSSVRCSMGRFTVS